MTGTAPARTPSLAQTTLEGRLECLRISKEFKGGNET